jgi:hypothetical protein
MSHSGRVAQAVALLDKQQSRWPLIQINAALQKPSIDGAAHCRKSTSTAWRRYHAVILLIGPPHGPPRRPALELEKNAPSGMTARQGCLLGHICHEHAKTRGGTKLRKC